MNTIQLSWKEFSVNLSKVRAYFKANLSADYDGLAAGEDCLTVIFFVPPSEDDTAMVSAYWDAATPTTFLPTILEIINLRISAAIQFGNSIIVGAATDNVIQGITQAGKTKEVSDYLRGLGRYLREGSLYAALDEIDRMVGEGVPEEIHPFVTEEKLLATKLKIQTFLGITP